MKKGDKVELINTDGIEEYDIMKQLKKGGVYTIQHVKESGGLILEEVDHPKNIFGVVQGIMKQRFRLVKEAKTSREVALDWWRSMTLEERFYKTIAWLKFHEKNTTERHPDNLTGREIEDIYLLNQK